MRRYRRLLTGILVAAACARIGYDFLMPNQSWLIVPILAVGFGAGAFCSRSRWALWGVLLYLATPVPMPRLALFGLVLAVVGICENALDQVGTVFSKPRIADRDWRWVAPTLAGIVAFVVLILTLSPGLLAADAGELQVVAAKWGVAHPPGYPLYTMLAGTVSHLLPTETPAWRVNLFSALTGAATISLIVFIVHRETRDALAGWLAGMVLLTATTFWMTATQASVRPLTVYFTALMLEAMLAYRHACREQRSDRLALIRFGLAAGLGVTHHGSVFFIGCVFALGIVAADTGNWRRWWIPPVVALVGLLPILYLPLRADGYLAPDYITTLDGLRYHVFAEGFAGDMFALAAPAHWPERFRVMIEVFRLQWHGGIMILALAGLLFAVVRDRWLGAILLVAFAVHSFVAGTYRAPQIVEYALPAYLIVAVAIGWSVGRLQRPYRVFAGALALYAGLSSFGANYNTMRQLASSEEARIAAQTTLDATPENINVLASWHRVTPLWYLQQVENARLDVANYYVTSSGAPTPMEEWADAINDHLAVANSVMVTQLYPETYRYLPYTFEHDRISRAPDPIAEVADGVAFGDHLLLTAQSEFAREVDGGESLSVRLTWGLADAVPFGTLTTFVHFGVADAPPLAQVDLPMQSTASGAVESVYYVQIPATVPPGEWTLFAGAYSHDGPLLSENGAVRVPLGTVRIHPGAFPLPSQHPLSIRMGDARLRGWDYDTTLPHAPVLYLHWRLDEPERQYRVLIRDVTGAEYASVVADVSDRTGYWTSVHPLPPDMGRLRVVLNGREFRLPDLPTDEHYILFGDLAALVDWQLNYVDDELWVTTEWLAAGAAYSEVGFNLTVPHMRDSQAGRLAPITDAIPVTKWSYGHRIRNAQTVLLNPGAPLEGVRLSLFDVYTGEALFISDTRLTVDAPGVYLGP